MACTYESISCINNFILVTAPLKTHHFILLAKNSLNSYLLSTVAAMVIFQLMMNDKSIQRLFQYFAGSKPQFKNIKKKYTPRAELNVCIHGTVWHFGWRVGLGLGLTTPVLTTQRWNWILNVIYCFYSYFAPGSLLINDEHVKQYTKSNNPKLNVKPNLFFPCPHSQLSQVLSVCLIKNCFTPMFATWQQRY